MDKLIEDMLQKLLHMCRLCMEQSEQLVPIFVTESDLASKLCDLFPKIKVDAGDGLPSQICGHCLHLVNMFYNFKQRCEFTENIYTIYRQYLISQDLNPEEEPSKLHGIPSDDCKLPGGAGFQNMHEMKDESTIKIEESDLEYGIFSESYSGENKHITSPSVRKPIDNTQETMDNSVDLPAEYVLQDHRPIQIKKVGVPQKYPPKHICAICNKKFPDRITYMNHKSLHHVHSRSNNDLKSAEPQLFKLHQRKLYACEIYRKRFSFHINYQKHKNIHLGLKPFQCSKCNKSFSTINSLHSHLLTHTGERPIICEICSLGFTQREALIHHMKAKHEEKKTVYSCTICHKSYCKLASVRKHMQLHSAKMDELEPKIHKDVETFFAEPVYLDGKVETITNEQFEATGTSDYEKTDDTNSSCTLKAAVHVFQIKPKPKTMELSRDVGISLENVADDNSGMHCRYCQKSFTSQHYLRKHATSKRCMRNARNPRIMCARCGLKFKDASDLARHDNFHQIKALIHQNY